MNQSETIDKEFLAWLAGFWEGEGSLFYREYDRKNPWKKSYVKFQVANTYKEPIDKIQSIFGGQVYGQRRNPPRRICWIWKVTHRKRVIEIAKMLLPYLQFKDKEVSEKLKILQEAESNHKSVSHRNYREFHAVIKEDYLAGLSAKEIARKHGLDYCETRELLVRWGIWIPWRKLSNPTNQ